RTMPVELDVWNPKLELASGMFPQVSWPVHRADETLFVPQSAVARMTDQSYVLRVRNGRIEQVNVKTGAAMGDLTEVFGNLKAGDEVAAHPGDDLRPGAEVVSRPQADAM
ncbi:MAG: efflux RND transporter periplasmic adaptor subunit, partial [Terracidiphilus sp.]